MTEAEDEAHGQRVWREAHALLEIVLDEVEAHATGWPVRFAELVAIVVPLRRPPAVRWKLARTGFARDAHHLIDMALRQDADIVAANVARLGAMLENKFAYQDALAAFVEPLKVVVQELAARAKGRLDPDTSDPLVTLRDALLQFDPREAKAMLRELLRPDKYRFQQTKTNDNETLLALQRYLDEPQFDIWKLDNPAAVSGVVAAGHPDRDTWWRDD